ncbi:DUF3857 domain-containing protein [Pinibacter soli]|uniref:DUF3857 domain-containing protein n=1 Tax=Pinibacter soli TaxID=3044211 RepID=A0ABT6RAX9_9BACT|nr:DUF3857 domain-containing protein [Pinibacter soli]MDI3319560.1 DUF3857 domain-containing protein [Pinibacter soli]
MKAATLIIAGFLTCLTLCSLAQEKLPIKFGRVNPSDFDLSQQKIDTGVNAVVIADVGSSWFEGNIKGSFSLIFKRQTRIKILNKNGMDAANFSIPLFSNVNTSQGEEKLDNLKAYTYNLEGGKVVETKLETNQVFKEKASKNWVVKKFTMPAVKEGSIIEVSYTVNSDFLTNLQPWEFQGKYPVLWSEYETSIPEFFKYVFLSQGYKNYDIKKNDQTQNTFNITFQNGASASERISIPGQVFSNRWVMKNVQPLKKEPYTSTLKNHIQKIEFQLSEIRYPNQPTQPIMASWAKVREDMMKDEDFGFQLYKNNNWLDDDMKIIVAGAKDQVEKMRRIYAYVRDNFTCTQHVGRYLSGSSLKAVMKAKSGNVVDLNLLLIAMLSHEGIQAYPVLLSTRSHGYTHELYPLMDRFNYVVACAMVGEEKVFLDATEPLLGFGRLEEECYNGHARILTETPEAVYLEPDSIKDRKLTTVFLTSTDKGKIQGSYSSQLGYFESLGVRERIKEKGKEEFAKKLKTAYGSDWKVDSVDIDSLKALDEPVTIHYDLALDNQEDIMYINPMLTEAYKENPFTAAERNYPVEMPYSFDETYVLNIEVPQNYVIDEIPKPAKVAFNDSEGYFEYLISKSENLIQMRTRVYFNKTNFQPEEYQNLREFFSCIVKKESEQIVLKKKKS